MTDADAPELERRQYKPGQTIFTQGEMGEDAYIVESGRVEIAKGNKQAEMIIGVVEPGSLIGEMALLDSAPRMATARAMKATTCVVIPKKVFDRMLRNSSPVLRVVLSTLMKRLRSEADANVKGTL